MIKPYNPNKFPMEIAGDFGTFFTDNKSPVFYLNTSFEIDNIQLIKAVREILDISEVDFDEMVQRDLDDLRIRQDIINYLVDGMGYKFFPPIVAAITQSEDSKLAIKKQYPRIKAHLEKGEEYHELHLEFDNAFSIIWYINGDEIISLPTRLKWRPDRTNLMAVDGQHRLVALQAIRGVITGEDLKLFYKDAVKEKEKLNDIKVPVVVLFFPNCASDVDEESLRLLNEFFPKVDWSVESKGNVKQVLRNIFVDVNKTARRPTTSRTILLDEKDLSSVFSRIVFSSIKDENPKIYTALLEYNMSSGKEVQIEKNRTTLTTIGIIHRICEYLFTDEPTDTGANLRMRFQIETLKEFPSSEEFPKSKIKTTEFDLNQREAVTRLFKERWLHVFKSLLTELHPYKRLISKMESEYDRYNKLIDNGEISKEDYKVFKILFGGHEKRFILESNAKLKSNTDERLTFKHLRDVESSMRDTVSDFDSFYTLMFQLGFFKSVSNLLEESIFENTLYLTNDNVKDIINVLNSYIRDNRRGSSLFDTNSAFYRLLFPTTKPEFAQYMSSIIELIAINYLTENHKNILVKKCNITTEKRERITLRNIQLLKERIKKSLDREFDANTENKIKKSEIQLAKENGDDNWKVLLSEYNLKKETYSTKHMSKQIEFVQTELDLSVL